MKNMFIVSVDNGEHEVTVEGLRTTLYKSWGGYGGVKFNVEEGDHRTIAGFVLDYMTAEDTLSKYEATARFSGGEKVNLDTPVGRRWKSLYDDVRAKRAFLVGKLRKYGCVV